MRDRRGGESGQDGALRVGDGQVRVEWIACFNRSPSDTYAPRSPARIRFQGPGAKHDGEGALESQDDFGFAEGGVVQRTDVRSMRGRDI